MLLKSNDGIICDLCGRAYRNSFTYYSFESTLVQVNTISKASIKQNKDLDIDVCDDCYQQSIENVKKFLNKIVGNTIKCDYCTNYMKGNFTYHKVLIHKVIVTNKKPEISNNHMDYNLDNNCFKQLSDKANNIKQTIKNEGEWS